ncbi:MAG TPA: LLM class flavin-dependent oxidoreductase [Blastocatellia bacterium]|nr:LLM class flavin-dependent oxidoreductase [Blastocatellia bacterium]
MRKLGLYLGRLPGFDKRGFDRRELIECVRTADACGYDSFWMPEAWEHDAFTVLTELATCTQRIHLCTGIINVFSRSPALIAMSAASLDEISGGRFRLGLGTSGARVVEDFHGIGFKKPLTRLAETIRIIRALLQGERVNFAGECFSLQRFKLGFKPLRSDIPIYLAALTPKSIQKAGELADGWLPIHWPRARLRDGITEICAGAGQANRDGSRIEIAPFVNVIVSDDVVSASNRARMPIAYYVGGMGDYYHASLTRLGFGAEADRIRELWRAGRPKLAIAAMSDEMVDSIAICGSLENCRARLDELYSQGATIPLVPVPGEGSTAEKCKVIEALIL